MLGLFNCAPLKKFSVFLQEKSQRNGITSKKGQKWGTTKCSFTQRNDCKDSNKDCSETLNNEKETMSYTGIDFDNLQPLCSMPKVYSS